MKCTNRCNLIGLQMNIEWDERKSETEKVYPISIIYSICICVRILVSLSGTKISTKIEISDRMYAVCITVLSVTD